MSSRRRPTSHRGVVTGYVLKLVRESIPVSQERFAAELHVDRTTVQSWESGRRPFTSVSVNQAMIAQHVALSMGADTTLLRVLRQAPEADYLIEIVLDRDPSTVDPAYHPLGRTVLTHAVTELVAWLAAGDSPTFLQNGPPSTARRGPVPDAPELDRVEQRVFFDNLRLLADRAEYAGSNGVVLHRQACFLAGLDPSGRTAAWLGPEREAGQSIRRLPELVAAVARRTIGCDIAR